MLFNSFPFLLVYLPIALAGYYLAGRLGSRTLAMAWLAAVSLFFYGWWNPAYLWLLLASIAVNFALGQALRDPARSSTKRALLTTGVVMNLALLAYFKYANFFVANLDAAFSLGLRTEQIILPLGISFFTFTQIAYLVDMAKKPGPRSGLVDYGLFVTFFPHLLAGPIIHHSEVMPQFANKDSCRSLRLELFGLGLSLFVVGLFKKVVLADSIAVPATAIFNAAAQGHALGFFESWAGALAYTFQLYFDFSGYSDMAIGLALFFNIRLPINFDSPYKARSIIDFWQRWHMTLSRFLRDYLYIPLGGNRFGEVTRYRNLFLTMLLGGLWHGAGWTFVAWGALHGLFLVINHAWRSLGKRLPRVRALFTGSGGALSWVLTFVCVVVSWVFFRAASFQAAGVILQGMFGLGGFDLPVSARPHLGGLVPILGGLGASFQADWVMQFREWFYLLPLFGLTLGVAFLAPSTSEYFGLEGAKPARQRWDLNPRTGLALGVLAFLALRMMSGLGASEFLYFNF